MTFRLVRRDDVAPSASPYRLVNETGVEVEWVNHFLDSQQVRGLRELSLRYYGNLLLPFLRWWAQQPGVDAMRLEARQFSEATLIDYVRAQRQERPRLSPETINGRSSMLRRVFRFYFDREMPHGPYRLQRAWWTPPGGRPRRGRIAVAADLRLRVPPRVIEPLSIEQVRRFWDSFGTARDIAVVGLMLLNGLRSCEVLSLELEDLRLSEGQLRVHGKGGKVRLLPLPPETIRLLDCYLRTERPLTDAATVFVSLKGQARGRPMTPAGLRSLFRHHRAVTAVGKANPHRFRHTFGSDMIRAGVSLPALQRLMGHANIETTMLYVQISPQDVYEEYTRAVAKQTAPARIAQP
jgi:site-specific recombinase XerD